MCSDAMQWLLVITHFLTAAQRELVSDFALSFPSRSSIVSEARPRFPTTYAAYGRKLNGQTSKVVKRPARRPRLLRKLGPWAAGSQFLPCCSALAQASLIRLIPSC
ncbi:hypothetical protein IF1G_00004 [Cordyceps javanica]|uniref:Secreted protein n=1 Tax=Cordyceps javanica TaxID=43265 RepID=A0A545VEC8_9HYPO|nr:hypothetical protein IF1G_00004 [Cordyceps javanica]